MVEFTVRGQTGLLQSQLLLTQHLLARAARKFRGRNDFHQTSQSDGQVLLETKQAFRCTWPELERRRQNGLLQVQLILTQYFLARAASFSPRCSAHHRRNH